MKLLLEITKRSLVCLATLACMVAGGSGAALATVKGPVLRDITSGSTHTGTCCSIWNQSVRVIEPDKLVPIVITWSTDYRSNAPFYSGLSVNGGPCTFYGSAYIPASAPEDETFASKTIQWVLMPGDYKLVKGANVIKLCGGGVFSDTDSITLGFNTLAARLEK
jgi:hypothetical protein